MKGSSTGHTDDIIAWRCLYLGTLPRSQVHDASGQGPVDMNLGGKPQTRPALMVSESTEKR